MIIVTFVGRDPRPEKISIAQRADNAAEIVHFEGVPIYADNQTVTLCLIDTTGNADAVILTEGNYAITRKHTQRSGTLTGYIEITTGTDIVWHP